MQKPEFNPEIYDKLKEVGIVELHDTNEALLYLLSTYHELSIVCLNERIVKQVNLTKIVERDYFVIQSNSTNPVKWNISLFIIPEHIDDNWEWVDKEYRIKFKQIRPELGGDKNGCVTKMKKFFAANPEIRKSDVLQAADLYITPFRMNNQNNKFMQRADYFISRVSDGAKLSRLEQYLEQLKDQKKESGGTNRRFEVIN